MSERAYTVAAWLSVILVPASWVLAAWLGSPEVLGAL